MTQINDTFASEKQAQFDRSAGERAASFVFRLTIIVPLTLLVGIEAGGWIASLLG